MSIVFLKNGNKHYYIYGDRIYELNENTFESLQSKIFLPLTIYFRDCSMEFIGNVVPTLFNESVDISVKKLDSKVFNETYDYEATLTKSLSMHM